MKAVILTVWLFVVPNSTTQHSTTVAPQLFPTLEACMIIKRKVDADRDRWSTSSCLKTQVIR